MPVWGSQEMTNALLVAEVIMDDIYYSPFAGYEDSENQYFDENLIMYGAN